MEKFFDWLSANPVATTTLTAAFGVVFIATTLIYVVAFIQGREISFWPPKIGSKITIKPQQIASQNSQNISFLDKKNEAAKVYLFGYFFIEQDGLEKRILVFKKPIYSALMSGEVEENTIEEAIDSIILKTIDQNGISKNEFLKAGLSRPTYYHLFKKVNAKVESTKNEFFNCWEKNKKEILQKAGIDSEKGL